MHFAQSLAEKLYNAVKHGAFDNPKDSAASLGSVMVDQAIADVDGSGVKYKKHQYSVDGFKPDLVDNNQDADVYRHILFTSGQALQGNTLTNWAFTQYDRIQSHESNPHAKKRKPS